MGPPPPACSGLLLRRVPTPNAYMDDPSGQLPPAKTPKHLYSNAERLQQLVTPRRWPPQSSPGARGTDSHLLLAHGLLLGFLPQQQSLDRAVPGRRRRPVSALPVGAAGSTLSSQAGEQGLDAPSRGAAGSPCAPQPQVLGGKPPCPRPRCCLPFLLSILPPPFLPSTGGSSPGQGGQPAAGEGEPRAPEQGCLPVPAHPDAAGEERGSGWAGYPHR